MDNIKLHYTGNSCKIARVCKRIEEILSSQTFATAMTNLGTFDMSSDDEGDLVSGYQLYQFVHICDPFVFEVRTQKTKWRWSKVNGWFKGGKTVYYNSRKLGRDEADIANTVTHEVIHALDGMITSMYLGHGDNSPKGKSGTTPWLVGQMIEELYDLDLEVQQEFSL